MKKRNWWLAPVVAFPYMIACLMIVLVAIFVSPEFARPTSRADVSDTVVMILVIPLIVYVLTAGCTITFAVKGIRKKWEPQQLAKSTMIVKLVQIPAYLFFGISGLICAIAVFGTLITIGLFILDCMILILTACLTAAAAINGTREGILSKTECVLFVLSQLVFCLDVVATIVCYGIIRKRTTEQRKTVIPAQSLQ